MMKLFLLFLATVSLSLSHKQECTTDGAVNVPGIVYSSLKRNWTLSGIITTCHETCVGDKGVGLCPKGVYGALAGLTAMTCNERNYTQIVTSKYEPTICNAELFEQFYRIYSKEKKTISTPALEALVEPLEAT